VAGSFRLQPADVHDVAQSTWLRLAQNLHTIRDPERLGGWLAITASHESLSILRKGFRDDLEPMVEDTPDSASFSASGSTSNTGRRWRR
jgi:DNA-directed RNA polymerase specialized sigma24 family protein